jgi:hypothetical protein
MMGFSAGCERKVRENGRWFMKIRNPRARKGIMSDPQKTEQPRRVFSWPQEGSVSLKPPQAIAAEKANGLSKRMILILSISGGFLLISIMVFFASVMSIWYYFYFYRPGIALKKIVPQLTVVQKSIGSLKKPLSPEDVNFNMERGDGKSVSGSICIDLSGTQSDGGVLVHYHALADSSLKLTLDSAELTIKYRTEPIDLMKDIESYIKENKEFGNTFEIPKVKTVTTPPSINSEPQ